MATVYKSVQVSFSSAVGAQLFTAVAQTIVSSIYVNGNTGTIDLSLTKQGGSPVVFLKTTSSQNGEILPAPVVLEVGDTLTATPTTTGASLTVSYAYSGTIPTDLSINALTDVDITNITDGQILQWNDLAGEFQPVTGGGGAVDSVNGETGAVVLDANDIDYAIGTTSYQKMTDSANAIVSIQNILKNPTDKVELEEDANNKIIVDGTVGSETITLKTDGVDAVQVNSDLTKINTPLLANQIETGGDGFTYTFPDRKGRDNEVLVANADGTTEFRPAALPTVDDTLEIDGVDFNLTPTASEANGRLLYDPDIESLVFSTANGNKIALGSVYLPVINKTASALPIGSVVKFVGAEGDRFKVELFDATAGGDEELWLVGVLEKEVAADAEGVAVQVGYVKGVDTSTYAVGTILYASTTPGQLTDIPPTKPNLVIPVGVVKTSASNGSIFVRPTAYHHLNEAHDVSVTAPTNEAVLAWNSTSQLWEPADNYVNTTGAVITGGIPVMTDSNSFKADTNLFVFNNEIVSTYDLAVADLTVSGNVGIGTTSPSANLQIGEIGINNGNRSLVITGYDASKIEFNNHDGWGKPTISTSYNGTVKFVDYGVQNNTLKFEFGESSTRQGAMRFWTNSNEAIKFGTNAAYPIGYIGVIEEGTNYTGGLHFKTSGGVGIKNDFVFNKDGNFGIGTTTPSEKLHVVGRVNLNDGNDNIIIGDSLGNSLTGGFNTILGYSAGSALTTGTGNTAVGYQAGKTVISGINNTLIGFGTDLNNATNSNCTIVGANTSAHVNAANQTGFGYGVRTGNQGTSVGVAAGSQNSTNQSALGYRAGEHASGTDGTQIGKYAGRYSTGGYNTLLGSEAGLGVSGTSTFSNTVAVGYQALTALTTGTGNTAVGYQAASSVVGQGNITAIGYAAGQNATTPHSVFVGTNAGQNYTSGDQVVAIGYNAASISAGGQHSIYVGGNAGAQAAGAERNVAIGQSAGYFLGGHENTLLGGSAGAGSGSSTFSQTVAVGHQALTALTTGASNTAIGYQSGNNILAGAQNTLVGYNATIANQNGSYNVIVGDSVSTSTGGNYATRVGSIGAVGNAAVSIGYGAGSTSGNNVVAIGYNAGKGSGGTSNSFIGTSAGEVSTGSNSVGVGYLSNRWTTGWKNVAIGNEALLGDGTSTFFNTTAVGYQALTALTIGARNTAVGYKGGAAITSGSANTLVGYDAGENLIGATHNVALGEWALTNATQGSYRVAIGAQALENATGSQAQGTVAIGFRAGEQSIGNDNVFLGREAGQTETGSNKLYIENSSSSTPLIYGEFDNDIVRINGDLQVTGDIDLSGGVTRNILINGDQYVFQYASGGTVTNYGLYFNLTNASFDFNNVSAEAVMSIGATNGNTEILGYVESKSIKVDDTNLSAAGDYGKSAEIWYQGTGATTAGGLYYLNSSGDWADTDASAASTAKGMLAFAAGTDSDVDGMITRGFVYLTTDPGGSIGDAVYLSETANQATTTAPTTSGAVVRVIGHKVSTNVIYFNPSNDYFEI